MKPRIFDKNTEEKKPSKPKDPQTVANPNTVPYPHAPITENGCPGCGMFSFPSVKPLKR